MNYAFFKLTCGVVATIGLYSVLYRETKFYRLFEHIFLGLAAGWAMVALWTETLSAQWWDLMVGTPADGPNPATQGHWLYAIMLPIGLMGYLVFSKKHNWMSRIPIGIILGLWSGQQIQVWWNRYGPNIAASMKPLVPTTWDSLFVPSGPDVTGDRAKEVASQVFLSQAISNWIFVLTLLCVMSYFIFSVDFKGKFTGGMTKWGRWLLMVGFGAIFGSTVMTRFSLLIDRMYFIWIEWLRDGVIHGLFHLGG